MSNDDTYIHMYHGTGAHELHIGWSGCSTGLVQWEALYQSAGSSIFPEQPQWLKPCGLLPGDISGTTHQSPLLVLLGTVDELRVSETHSL